MAVVSQRFNQLVSKYQKQGLSYDKAFAKAQKGADVTTLKTRRESRPSWWHKLAKGIKKELGMAGKKEFKPSRKFR